MDIGLRVCGTRNPAAHSRILRDELAPHFGRFAFSRRAIEYFPVESVVRLYVVVKAGYAKKDGESSAGPRECIVNHWRSPSKVTVG